MMLHLSNAPLNNNTDNDKVTKKQQNKTKPPVLQAGRLDFAVKNHFKYFYKNHKIFSTFLWYFRVILASDEYI